MWVRGRHEAADRRTGENRTIPAVRGRRRRQQRRRPDRGTIPAGAGPTSPGFRIWRTPQDHPRGCGPGRCRRGRRRDHPRRVWGRDVGSGHDPPPRRTIPAGGAEPTTGCPVPGSYWPGHPRGAGPTAPVCRSARSSSGHPRGRGADRPVPRELDRPCAWTLPAGAGPAIPVNQRVLCRAIPRRCGADDKAIGKHKLKFGPSPQVRGPI